MKEKDIQGRPLVTQIAIALLGVIALGTAIAQSATDSRQGTPPSPNDASSDRLEEIVVIAEKRAQNIQDVPIAVTAVTGQRLTDLSITNTLDLVRVVPGLTVESSVSGFEPHLRGVGTTALSAGTENSVATYVDGVYMASLNGALIQLSNIEQVEVLKGPQGTLFGRNATGGVISIRTRDPSDTFGGDASVRYGNYNTVSAQGYLTGPVMQGIKADIAGFGSYQGDGYGRNLYNGRDVNQMQEGAVRSKILIEPGDRDQIRLTGDYSILNGNAFDSFTLLRGTAQNYGPGNTTAAQRPDLAPYVASGALAPFAVVGEPFSATGGFYDIDVYNQPKYVFKGAGTSLQWDHEFDNLKLVSISAYRESSQSIDWDSVPVPAFRGEVQWNEPESQFSQELQVGSKAGATIPWVAGLYFLDAKADYDFFNILGTPIAPLNLLQFVSHTNATAEAAFLQTTLPLWSGAHLTLGGRYTVEKHGVSGETNVQLVPEFGGGTSTSGATDQSKIFKRPTWRISLDQKLTPDLMVYVSYNRGFKSGLYNSIPAGGEPIQPEILDAYEGGIKAEFLDGRVRFNAAGWYYDYKNLQVTIFTSTSAVLQNGAAAKLYGTDFDWTAKIGPHLTLYGGGSVMHSEFTSYPGAPFFLVQSPASGGGTTEVTGDAKGNRLPYAPDYTFNAGQTYILPLPVGEANLSLNYSYSGRWFNGPDNLLSQAGYGLLNGTLNYSFANSGVKVGLFAQNLTNQKYYLFLAGQANPGGHQQGVPGAPLTFGVMAGYKF